MRWRHGWKKWMAFASGDLLDVLILVVLAKNPTYGYSLIEELSKFGINMSFLHPAMVYRNLRQLEMEGLVISNWETGPSGPARRIYTITQSGKEYLKNWYNFAKQDLKIMENIINEIEKLQKGGE